jgi:hypothetical protein
MTGKKRLKVFMAVKIKIALKTMNSNNGKLRMT